MPYLRIYIGDDDADIMETWNGLPANGKSAWVKDAMREKARRESGQQEDRSPARQPVTAAELREILRDELSGTTVVSPKAQGEASCEAHEDAQAANKILSMF